MGVAFYFLREDYVYGLNFLLIVGHVVRYPYVCRVDLPIVPSLLY